MLQADAGVSQQQEELVPGLLLWNIEVFQKKKRKISTNLLHATPALHQLSLGAESALQLTWPSTA